MPAVNTWIGISDNFSNAAYWTDGVPTFDDILVFTGPQSPPPPLSPPPGFPPPPPVPPAPYSHASVTFPSTANLSYAGIHFENNYGGTVTFPADISFSDYEQDAGATSQAADTVVSISTTFDWTGGAINSSSNVATYQLMAVLNGQIGDDSTTLNTGSRILLDNNNVGLGSYVQQAGVLNQLNGVPIEVNEGSTLDQRLINQNAPAPLEAGDIITNGHTYSNGGKVKSVKVNNANGWLKVSKDGLEVTNRVPGSNYNYGVEMSNGSITLQCGGTLKSTYGVRMSNGTFETPEDTGGNPSNTATIDGQFVVDGGVVRLTPANENRYTVLRVTTSVFLNAGLFDAGVKGTANFVSDQIVADSVTAPTTFKVRLTEKEGAAGVGKKWDLILSDSGFYGMLNDYPTPDQPNVYSGGYTPDLKGYRMTKK